MVSFPNAKINLGLQIKGKRKDGYHDLQTVFYPINIKDVLEIITAEDSQKQVQFTSSGLNVDGKAEDNLCIKAYQLLKKDFPLLPSVRMHLHKHIPMGAGMGGGSADAAFSLQMLNDKYKLQLSSEKLYEYALTLGSDCPFFILNKPCIAEGRGELMKEINLSLSPLKIVVVNPGIHVHTADAFKALTLRESHTDLSKAISKPIEQWKNLIVNDFEKPVFQKHPVLQDIKTRLYEAGAIFALMSGSGSTIYGIFDEKHHPDLQFPDTYFLKWV
jgi:4-diphosphocytidyl-2-C-methyl-D-erythritol kinase